MLSRFPSCYRSLNLTLYGVIALEVALAIAYLSTSFRWGYSPNLLDLNGMLSLSSFLQAAHLFAIGVVASGLLMVRRYTEDPLSWILLILLMVLSLLGGFDELTKTYISLPLLTWRRIYGGLAIAIVLLCWRDLVKIWCFHRAAMLWMGLGLGLIAIGGYGFDKVQDELTQILAALTVHGSHFHIYRMLVAVEECSEMFGETLLVFGVCILAFDHLRTLRDPDESLPNR